MTQNQSGDERTYWPLERWLFEVDRRVLFAIALGIAAIMDGVFVTPNIEDWLAVAQSPFSTPDFSNPLNSYIMSSPLPAVFAGLLGADRHWAVFGAFHLLLLVTVVWLTMRAASHVHPDADRLVLAVFIAAPISTVTLTWLGQPDPLVIGLGSALVFLRRPIPLALVGILLGLSSFEQGAFIVLSVGLVAAPLLGAVWWRHTLASGIGILVGRAAFTLYHAAFDIEQATTRYDSLSDLLVAIPPVLTVLGRLDPCWQLVLDWTRSRRSPEEGGGSVLGGLPGSDARVRPDACVFHHQLAHPPCDGLLDSEQIRPCEGAAPDYVEPGRRSPYPHRASRCRRTLRFCLLRDSELAPAVVGTLVPSFDQLEPD